MGQRVLVVRVGDRYGPEYETYLDSKIPNITWVRQPLTQKIKLQWNKMVGMSLDIDEPIVVMDIDILLQGDYMDMINYPIERGQFVCMNAWWQDTAKEEYCINGGFYKYYPKDCKYIWDKFMDDPEYWQNYYIENGTTHGPVNGEQYFIEDSINQRLQPVYIPQTWYGKFIQNPNRKWIEDCNESYPGEYFYDYSTKTFHPEVKFIHYQKSHSLHG